MGNDPNYRHYYTSLPSLRIYDGATLKRSIVFLQTENDVQASNYNWQPEFDCDSFMADDKTVTEFPAGVRLTAEIAFHVYAPEFAIDPQANLGPGVSFTERDWIYLLKAQQLGYDIYFYPHADRPLGTDARFRCHLVYCRPAQPDGKSYRAEWSLGLEGVSTTADPLDEF